MRLSKMFNLAEIWGLRPDGSNPCLHVKKYHEEKRERFLGAVEYAALGRTLAEVEADGSEPPSVIATVRLLMLTGCRDLRHSFASGALFLGEGLPMIGKLLGHPQVQTTARYAHLAAFIANQTGLRAQRGLKRKFRSRLVQTPGLITIRAKVGR
ncbi:hypothetical protein [Azospirillum sp. RU38E]|uniref:hypothetical protein n=1 Tax=unclassified Azospirillum TaxID=2630922 RepID=UPI000B7003E9|nr:hypothetical protein SAMN05880556_12728 [Azospirillum sp. RU38E]SNT28364.1 hypothetical protein SAMN05880591_12728 [Azospirillum sp. RU37A]